MKLTDLSFKVDNKEQELKLLNFKVEHSEEAQEKIFQAQKDKYEEKLKNEYSEMLSDFKEKIAILDNDYTIAEENAKSVYLQLLQELTATFVSKQTDLNKTISELEAQRENEKTLVETAIAARKREEEEAKARDFYRLQLTGPDLEDIEKLNDVALLLNTPETLYKTIWKVYYEKPYTDLVGRVLGVNPITGIYKITNIGNGKSYVGQAVNVQERWRQHIKRGCRAEAPTRNKLYPAMIEEGVHNFYFELLEECPRDQLDTKEDYWQSFFQTTSYGYSIK